MPVFRLTEDLAFPPSELAEDDGLLAVGGDLSVDRLILAYSMGIFPWYSDGYPILWWSPDPRLILIPQELKVSRSLRQTIKKDIYTITMDKAFEQVISNCADIHRGEDDGTWITSEMMMALGMVRFGSLVSAARASSAEMSTGSGSHSNRPSTMR